MGEIIGGAIFMALFIAFAVWKGGKKGKITDAERRLRDDEYWADEEKEGSGGLFSFSMGSSDGDSDDDGDGGGDD
ncbi:MAG: hypothetical protein HUN04_12100 [Desulfobacter sp.]|nr:MAG: hypothetical protein HUN04_12100 [Desulfobacter sp.]